LSGGKILSIESWTHSHCTLYIHELSGIVLSNGWTGRRTSSLNVPGNGIVCVTNRGSRSPVRVRVSIGP
jgi:hypothetical protein